MLPVSPEQNNSIVVAAPDDEPHVLPPEPVAVLHNDEVAGLQNDEGAVVKPVPGPEPEYFCY